MVKCKKRLRRLLWCWKLVGRRCCFCRNCVDKDDENLQYWSCFFVPEMWFRDSPWPKRSGHDRRPPFRSSQARFRVIQKGGNVVMTYALIALQGKHMICKNLNLT